MASPTDRKYSTDHEWVLVDGDVATIGITKYAADQLGSIVFVELPEEGESFGSEDAYGEVESVKSVSELLLPVGGEVVAINQALEDAPETVNDDPYGEGWLVRVRLDNKGDLDELIDGAAYDASLA
ncbi:MAG: glycine cleavage system protein GcvH [Coriobacteriia bacterium]|nr:glycine cleavage system protein GcvH [Coriobacteriia bacterium]MCL2746296.1 glycine cleavage system protein GcvH [Coriobacteriia bacterium]MCL2870681.1 glycine cleavage system protein GcvH [Coriobacteriia bacterium]